jgi:DNA-binding NarL/FixJ family response regulator
VHPPDTDADTGSNAPYCRGSCAGSLPDTAASVGYTPFNDGYRAHAPKTIQGPSIDTLSRQEQTIIKLVAEGERNKQLAESLPLSERTIEKYRSQILKKPNLSRTSELIKYALKHGI